MPFRTVKGAEIYARVEGFISPVRKHNMNVFPQLNTALNNQQILFKAF